MERYKICKITPGKVSLQELSEYFGFLPEKLRWFHNRFCPLSDLIDPEIQSHVEVIYIPVPEVQTGYFATKRKKKPFYEKVNTLNIPSSFEKRYGIVQKVYENETEKLKLHYETELKKTSKEHLIISRKQLYIDDKRPDMVMEQIAAKVGNVFYPLQLELCESAKLKHIANFPEIQKRWNYKKQQLASYYKGEVAEIFFNTIDNQFEYRSKTQRGILDSWFFVLYFFPLYETFTDEKMYTFQVTLPIFPKQPKLLFEITLSINEEVSESQKFIITAKGKCIDDRIISEIENGKAMHNPEIKGEKAEGNFDFTYKLNAKNNSIFAIWGEIDLKLSKAHRKISFECCEQ